jgi:hypothetical protein
LQSFPPTNQFDTRPLSHHRLCLCHYHYRLPNLWLAGALNCGSAIWGVSCRLLLRESRNNSSLWCNGVALMATATHLRQRWARGNGLCRIIPMYGPNDMPCVQCVNPTLSKRGCENTLPTVRFVDILMLLHDVLHPAPPRHLLLRTLPSWQTRHSRLVSG